MHRAIFSLGVMGVLEVGNTGLSAQGYQQTQGLKEQYLADIDTLTAKFVQPLRY